VHKKLGKDTAGTADPIRPKGYYIPYDIVFNNKTGGEEGGKGECLLLFHLSSQVAFMRDGALLSWGWLNTCLLMGSSE